MSKNGVITIGRRELYERVWATPMRTLAAEPPLKWLFPAVGVLLAVLAASFHYLMVEDRARV